ncbi:MarR family transcriptional regulator [Cupriavidus sp. CER94]|nr:MarR family transcriptional regulator [Cupriavidus sp. U2]
MLHRLLILATMMLSALACELGGGGDRCAWKGMPGQYRVDAPGRRRKG